MKNLKSLREEMGLTQQKLADQLHVSQQAIYKYEHGFAQPNISMLIRMAAYFNTSIDYLVGKSSLRYIYQSKDLSDEDVQYLDKYHRLSQPMQEKLDALISQIIKEAR